MNVILHVWPSHFRSDYLIFLGILSLACRRFLMLMDTGVILGSVYRLKRAGQAEGNQRPTVQEEDHTCQRALNATPQEYHGKRASSRRVTPQRVHIQSLEARHMHESPLWMQAMEFYYKIATTSCVLLFWTRLKSLLQHGFAPWSCRNRCATLTA